MDVNGTHFQLLLGCDDWANCSATEDGSNQLRQVWKHCSFIDGAPGLAWDDERSELILHPSRLQIISPLTHTPPQLKDRRGAGRDRYGNWYWIDTSGNELLVYIFHFGKIMLIIFIISLFSHL